MSKNILFFQFIDPFQFLMEN